MRLKNKSKKKKIKGEYYDITFVEVSHFVFPIQNQTYIDTHTCMSHEKEDDKYTSKVSIVAVLCCYKSTRIVLRMFDAKFHTYIHELLSCCIYTHIRFQYFTS